MTDKATLPAYLDDLVAAHRRSTAEARGVVYRALFRAARRGDRCPTGDDLCDLTGMSLTGTVYIVQNLEARGLIRVWRYQKSRVVEIVATGERTAASGETIPHRARGTRQIHKPRAQRMVMA